MRTPRRYLSPFDARREADAVCSVLPRRKSHASGEAVEEQERAVHADLAAAPSLLPTDAMDCVKEDVKNYGRKL